jgi:hypothetical protein
MTPDHRRLDAQMAQGILLDDPNFLHEIVERVLQELLEAEIPSTSGLLPTSAPPSARAIAPDTREGRFVPGWAL